MSVTSTQIGQIGLATIAGRIVPAVRKATETLAQAGESASKIDRLWHLSDSELADRGFKRSTLVDQVIAHRG